MSIFTSMGPWRVIDDSAASDPIDPAWHFAVDAALAQTVGDGLAPPTLRLWRHPGAVIVGPREGRLPTLATAAATWGAPVFVRPSGGALVPLDDGVLNASLVYPTDQWGIDDGYRAMYELIRAALRPLGREVEQGEILGSYCPGEYDLAFGGRKFAGIAQRRTRLGTVVGAFLLVEGAGALRAQKAAAFYQAAGGGLGVSEQAMGSLAEALDGPISMRLIAQALTGALAKLSGDLIIAPLTEAEEALADDRLDDLALRQPEGLRAIGSNHDTVDQ